MELGEGKTGAVRAFGVYLITDRLAAPGNDIIKAVEGALKGGIKCVQLREKGLSARELIGLAARLRSLTKDAGALLLINDRVDVALAAGADGVHLGQESISAKDARELLGAGAIIGVSAHSMEEARDAEALGADLITFGPVYHTPSKAAYGAPVGAAALKEVAARITIPVYALGGAKKGNIREVLAAGAAGVAVISAVIASSDPAEAAQALLREVAAARAKGL